MKWPTVSRWRGQPEPRPEPAPTLRQPDEPLATWQARPTRTSASHPRRTPPAKAAVTLAAPGIGPGAEGSRAQPARRATRSTRSRWGPCSRLSPWASCFSCFACDLPSERCFLHSARAEGSLPAVKPTVLLFDVDGTLVTTCGAGRRAVERAFELRHGTKEVLSFSFGGMTDKAIVRDGLLGLGRPFASEAELLAEMEATLGFYLEVLAEEVDRTRIRIHDGMERAMDMAEARREVALGLGTGNIRKGAEIKLGCVGIYHRFTFGGFGDDSIDRPTLLMAGARRGAEKLGASGRGLPHRRDRRHAQGRRRGQGHRRGLDRRGDRHARARRAAGLRADRGLRQPGRRRGAGGVVRQVDPAGAMNRTPTRELESESGRRRRWSGRFRAGEVVARPGPCRKDRTGRRGRGIRSCACPGRS